MNNMFLYQKVYGDIYDKILNNEFQPGSLIPSENELCSLLDVSLITVRRALKELEDNGVVKKVKGKGTFVREDIRIDTTKKKNKNIGILDIPFSEQLKYNYPQKYEYENNWKNKIYSTLFTELADDFNVIIDGYMIEDIMVNFEYTAFANIDRLIVMGEYNKQLIDFLHNKGKYVLVYNNFDRNLNVCSVSNNERHAVKKAVQFLIENGHTRIGAINGLMEFSESVERYMGFQEALVFNDIMIRTELIKWGNMTPESGYFLMKDMIKSKVLPTAVFCVNDGVAMGALDAIKEKGLKCPEDISIISHDNNDICNELKPRLSSIDPKYQKVGFEIAKKLKRNIWVDDISIVTSKLIVRDSVAPVKGFKLEKGCGESENNKCVGDTGM